MQGIEKWPYNYLFIAELDLSQKEKDRKRDNINKQYILYRSMHLYLKANLNKPFVKTK